MEPSYMNDWAPLDTIINSVSSNNINSNINHNKASSKVAAYDNHLQNLLSMQKSAYAELELFRRIVVDGGATSSTPAFNMMPSTHHYPLSASPLAQLLSTSNFHKPFTTPSPKRSRDSNTLSHASKEEGDNKDGEEKGRKVWKKVKSKVKKEELNTEEGRRREEEEEKEEERKVGAQEGKGGEKEKVGKASYKRGGSKGAKAPASKGALTKASSSYICSSKGDPCKEKVLPPPPPPPPPPKTDFIHVRARRGQATDSHSLAERVRREKISERMRFLQDLVPGCSKITGKAMMLDEIINYVQSLQHQVEFLATKSASLHLEKFDINADDTFMEEEIASALAEVHGACPNVVVQAMEQQCPSYHMQMHDFPFVNVRFCDDDDLPFISDVSTSSLI